MQIESGVVVERLEWGRFYGVPIQCFELVLLPKEQREQLQKAERLIAALQAAEFSGEELGETLTKLQEGLASYRRSLITQSAEQAQAAAGEVELQFGIRADDDFEVLEADGEGVTDARLSITDSAKIADRLDTSVDRAVELREELDDLRERVSRLDAEIAELRIDIRQAELDSDAVASIEAEASHYSAEQIAQLEQHLKAVKSTDAWLDETLASIPGIDSGLADELQSLIEQATSDRLPAVLERHKSELATWLAGADSDSESIRDALAAYAQGYQDALEQKRPLEQQIDELELQASRDSFQFCVPNGSTILTELSTADAAAIAGGTLTAAAAEQLGVPAGDNVVAAESFGDSLTLVFLDGQDGNRQALSITPRGYVDGAAQPILSQLQTQRLAANEIVRVVQVNKLTFGERVGVYWDRWAEFLLEDPREANSEGGVFPAIWGTIVMTLIMTIAVVPFGVMAALYLREYAGSGPLVSVIRISINNLAGVPSIVYGVFGFSFFCYTIGAYIDGGAKNADITPWPAATWFVWLAACAVIGTAAFFASLSTGGPTGNATAFKKWVSRLTLVLWLSCLAIGAALILKSPFFDGFYQAQLPNPTFGKGGLLWAALTLALLTLPVVIVATEEALSAVPNSLREGSLACGASKWQTIRRIILPHARPGILTGAILAMARGAGEVAPLMLVGALPSAPDLPLDSEFPFFHGSRSFMHLGYQIYTLGFQSQNSDAAVPMVFTCTLLLIAIVAALNIFAIFLRARLKRRFQGNQF
ncbi:MAG TPA: hypothetical protein DDW52_25730 [Planctomycetaceae bacterium]|nr:hypothetical protein [Planctomycetaceae bacterium]